MPENTLEVERRAGMAKRKPVWVRDYELPVTYALAFGHGIADRIAAGDELTEDAATEAAAFYSIMRDAALDMMDWVSTQEP